MSILIVEDDKTSRLLLRRILEKLGQTDVREAEDGQKAWELLEAGLLPSLCFLDVNMPNLNGLELLKRIRQDRRFAASIVCFCSAVRDRKIVAQAVALKPDFFLLKPYSESAIQAQLLRARRSARSNKPLDSTNVVCGRLGIERDTYLASLDKLINDVRSLTTRIPNFLVQHNVADALLALDETKSAAQNLGAWRVFQLADNLARHFRSNGGVIDHVANAQNALVNESAPWICASTDLLLDALGNMHGELRCLEQVHAEMAHSHPKAQATATEDRAPPDTADYCRGTAG
jgi:two-component system, chemotaxis family, chemotaxis protein CheY